MRGHGKLPDGHRLEVMGRLVPEEVTVKHDVNLNINLHVAESSLAVRKNMESLIWTVCLASVMRSWFRKK